MCSHILPAHWSHRFCCFHAAVPHSPKSTPTPKPSQAQVYKYPSTCYHWRRVHYSPSQTKRRAPRRPDNSIKTALYAAHTSSLHPQGPSKQAAAARLLDHNGGRQGHIPLPPRLFALRVCRSYDFAPSVRYLVPSSPCSSSNANHPPPGHIALLLV